MGRNTILDWKGAAHIRIESERANAPQNKWRNAVSEVKTGLQVKVFVSGKARFLHFIGLKSVGSAEGDEP